MTDKELQDLREEIKEKNFVLLNYQIISGDSTVMDIWSDKDADFSNSSSYHNLASFYHYIGDKIIEIIKESIARLAVLLCFEEADNDITYLSKEKEDFIRDALEEEILSRIFTEEVKRPIIQECYEFKKFPDKIKKYYEDLTDHFFQFVPDWYLKKCDAPLDILSWYMSIYDQSIYRTIRSLYTFTANNIYFSNMEKIADHHFLFETYLSDKYLDTCGSCTGVAFSNFNFLMNRFQEQLSEILSYDKYKIVKDKYSFIFKGSIETLDDEKLNYYSYLSGKVIIRLTSFPKRYYEEEE